jgi:hypothetical protein
MGLINDLARLVMRSRNAKDRERIELSRPDALLARTAGLQAEGARWMRDGLGHWHRWSYLGDDWEPQDAAPPDLAAVAAAVPIADRRAAWRNTEGAWRREPDTP